MTLTYWANLKGHGNNHSTKIVLQPCQERERVQCRSFGWVIGALVDQYSIGQLAVSPTVPLSTVPYWVMGEVHVDTHLLERKQQRSLNSMVVTRYIEKTFLGCLKVYTDASRLGDKVRVAFIIPELGVMESHRVSDSISVFTGELMVIFLALGYVEANQYREVVIASDSSSAISSIKLGHSESRQDIVIEILQILYRIKQAGINMRLIWVPAHMGEGNELADRYAKQAGKKREVTLHVPYSRG